MTEPLIQTLSILQNIKKYLQLDSAVNSYDLLWNKDHPKRHLLNYRVQEMLNLYQ